MNSKKWQMSFNTMKCHTLRITKKRIPVRKAYILNNTELSDVTHHPYLGIELNNKLTWEHHINTIKAKANRCLGFLRRNLNKCPENVKQTAYKALVRPHLEYASSVWSPHKQKEINSLESVSYIFSSFLALNEPRSACFGNFRAAQVIIP